MIKGALPVSFRQEILDAVHAPGDDYKIALFTEAASLDSKTKSYSGQPGEVHSGNGNGYKAGGIPLAGRKTGIANNSAFMSFDNPRWVNATFTARGALIYNASKQNRAVAVIDFGQDHTCTNGTFVVTLPDEGANAIVVIS
jgi:hypothetical protein